MLVRAYADRPFVGQVHSTSEKGLRVARADANIDDAATPAAGVSWEDAFEVDGDLIEQLKAATKQSARSRLWIKARPLRPDNGNSSERRFAGPDRE